MSLFFGCRTIPEGVTAVQSFKLDRYLGTWYEIARFDYRFERGLSNVTANYSLRKDGFIKVDNKGYEAAKSRWKESVGKAKPASERGEAMFKVSFFGPFYAGYNVIDLTDDYQNALVAGDSRSYLWLLSRSPQMPEEVKKRFLDKAAALGFDTGSLLWVSHDQAVSVK